MEVVGSACVSEQSCSPLLPQLTTTAVMSAPRLGGDRKPKQAKTGRRREMRLNTRRHIGTPSEETAQNTHRNNYILLETMEHLTNQES